MKNFQDFYIELIEDERFYENASRNHKKETVEETARKVYEIESVDRDAFEVTPMAEHRKHLLNKLYKLPPDKVKKTWNEIALEEKEKEKKATEPEWIPLTGEAMEKRKQEVLAIIANSTMASKIPPLTARERMNDDWRPKPNDIKEPTEIEKRSAYVRHLKRVRESRSLLFLEAYPDAQPEEVEAYLNKFAHIDNPLQLDI